LGCHVPSRRAGLHEEEEKDIDGNRDVWEYDEEGIGCWGKLDAVRTRVPLQKRKECGYEIYREDVDRLEGRKECYI
jgi:hypothetical protein